ncbi:hypothetical protein wCIFem_11600 [Wolbachia pipientis]
MWLVLAYNEITILKSSYGTLGRPIHSKTNSSHTADFERRKWLYYLNLLTLYTVKLTAAHLRFSFK